MTRSDFNPWINMERYNPSEFADKTSELPQWPIKLWQVPVVSPYFHRAHLLVAADCSAFANPTFHDTIARGKLPLICCPATDFDVTTKLESILSHNDIASITVVRMEKKCCTDLVEQVMKAAKSSRLPIPVNTTCLFVDAEDVT